MADETTLPQKCCANCGFLYAKDNGLHPVAGYEIFDPNLLRTRLNELEQNVGHLSFFEKNISSHSRYFVSHGAILSSTYDWYHLLSINCFWSVFDQLNPGMLVLFDRGGVPPHYREDVVIKIFSTLKADRANCPNYYLYRPGFSAKEHAEIRLQDVREQEHREFQERQNFLFLEWERIAAERDIFWKQQLEKAEEGEKIYKVRVDFITLVIALLALIVSIVQFVK